MLEQLLSFLGTYLNLFYLITFLTLSYTLKDIGKDLLGFLYLKIFKKETTIKNVYIVLIIALLLAIPFYLYEPCKECLMKLLLTYSIGTSIYEIFIKQFEPIVTKFFGNYKK